MSFRDKMVMRKVFYLVILILVVSMIPIPFMSCSSTPENTTPGYVTETFTKRGIDFSFEYPDDYEKYETGYEEEIDEVDYIVLQYYASTYDGTFRKIINIQLWNPTEDWQDARTKLDYYLAHLGDTGQDPEVKERSSLQVAGVVGEKAVFSVVMTDITNIPNKLTGWIAAFDYRGQIWFLVVTTNMETPDEVEADFGHIIESFKFLD
jgi:hypothetical protein